MHNGKVKLAYYGDDFTGASDSLATLTEGGLRALLFLGVPNAGHLDRAGPLDALGIAGAARSMGPEAMRAELAPVAPFLAATGARVIQYKCCSTFDSSATTGNLAVGLQSLARALHDPLLAVLGGQPSLGRYCLFGQLFASAGGQEVFRIDRHPTMSRHPVTPMDEADLRRHLAHQGLADLALHDYRQYASHNTDAAALPGKQVLFDISESAQLPAIGRTLWQQATKAPLAILGASSVSEALLAHWRSTGEAPPAPEPARLTAHNGPVLVLSGSQSPLSARQIEAAKGHFHHLMFDPQQDDTALLEAAQDVLGSGHHLLIQMQPPKPGGLAPHQAAAIGGAMLARLLHRVPAVRRVGIAGGDTSSLAVQALDVWALQHVCRLAPGVSVVRARSDDARFDGIELMLKGGQMGQDDLFRRLLGQAN